MMVEVDYTTAQEVSSSNEAVTSETINGYSCSYDRTVAHETAGEETLERKLPEEKDVIEWQGKTFTVRSVTPCYTRGEKPHHWEVTLE